MSTGVRQITGLRAGPTSPVPAHIRPGGGCSHDATSALLSSCKEDSEKGKPLSHYQAQQSAQPLPKFFFFFASHCSHRLGKKEIQKTWVELEVLAIAG